MPFTNSKQRKNPDGNIPGDRCYLMYKKMIDQWNESPRWTTADAIYAWVTDLNQPDIDWQRAKELAWQVFFVEKVMPYEQKKKKENGDVL